MDIWYSEKAAKEYQDDIFFPGLKAMAGTWSEKAFAVLADTETLYEAAVKFLATKRGCEVAFRNLLSNSSDSEKKITINNYRRIFIFELQRPISKGTDANGEYNDTFIAFGRMKNRMLAMNPTRYFLFEALETEIERYKGASLEVPAIYTALEKEYLEIINYLCSSCYLLVPKLALEIKTDKLTYEDCIAYGNVGLVKAAHRFDFERTQSDNSKNIRFTTYARWWIRERILNAIERNTFFLSVDCKTRDAYYKSTKGITLNEGLITEGQHAAYLVQLDECTDDESSVADTIDNSYSIGSSLKNPEEALGEKDWSAAACELFPKVLTDLEYNVIKRKFEVLNCSHEMDDASIAKETNISRNKVPMVVTTALEKLKKNVKCMDLIHSLLAAKAYS